MSERKQVRAVDLGQIEKQSGAVERFRAVLCRRGADPWAARFAASGGKVPALPPAPATPER